MPRRCEYRPAVRVLRNSPLNGHADVTGPCPDLPAADNVLHCIWEQWRNLVFRVLRGWGRWFLARESARTSG